MARLIEIQDVTMLPTKLSIRLGDILWFSATGGRVSSNEASSSVKTDVVRALGAFSPGVVGPAGEIVSPAGPPSTVLFLASSVGAASIEVMTGDPWHHVRTTLLDVTVEP